MTDQCINPTVEPYSVLEEVGEPVIAAVDILGVMSLEVARSNHFFDKSIEWYKLGVFTRSQYIQYSGVKLIDRLLFKIGRRVEYIVIGFLEIDRVPKV